MLFLKKVSALTEIEENVSSVESAFFKISVKSRIILRYVALLHILALDDTPILRCRKPQSE